MASLSICPTNLTKLKLNQAAIWHEFRNQTQNSPRYYELAQQIQRLHHLDNTTHCCVPITEWTSLSMNDLTTFLQIRVIFMLLYAAIFITAFVGNTLVIAAVCRYPTLQTVRNMFIVNLSVSDLIVTLISIPPTAYIQLYKEWTFGWVLCHIVPTLQGVAVIISSFTLASIAIDRFILLVKVGWTPITKLQAAGLVFGIWTSALAVCMPMALHMDMLSGLSYAVEVAPLCGVFCEEDWSHNPRGRTIYGVTLMVFQFAVPLAIVTFCYACIIRTLNRSLLVRQSRAIVAAAQASARRESLVFLHNPRNYSLSIRRTSQEPVQRSQDASTNRATNALERRSRTNRMQIAMVLFFAVSWCPHVLLNVLRDAGATPSFVTSQQYFYATVAHLCAMTSTLWNPFLYGFMNTAFRVAFADIARTFHPSRVSSSRSRRPASEGNHNNNNGRLRSPEVPPETSTPLVRSYLINGEAQVEASAITEHCSSEVKELDEIVYV